MNNYPPGVTGNEWQIAGPDKEFEAEMRCKHCNAFELTIVSAYRGDLYWQCQACDEDNESYIDHDLV